MNNARKKTLSPSWYALGGLAAGTTLGFLFAPKAGKKLRGELDIWARENGKQIKAMRVRKSNKKQLTVG